MGVAALVLGIIAIVLAFFGGVGGIILGIAAVVLGVLGRRAAERDGLPQGSATAGMVTGIIGIVLGAAIFAACVKCASGCAEVARGIARLGEARGTLEQVARLEMAYYDAERVDPKGNLLPRSFVSARPVPATVPCQEKPVMVTPEDWKAAGWDTIHFMPSGPTMFQFEVAASGEGNAARADIIARADPRCDGIVADLKVRLGVDKEGRPYVMQNPFGPQRDHRAGYRRGVRRGAAPGAPGALPEPADEPPGEEEPDEAAPVRPVPPGAPAGAKPPAVPVPPAPPQPGPGAKAPAPAPAPAAPVPVPAPPPAK